MAEFIRILTLKMEVPKSWGWFHLMWFGITIVACALVCVFRKKMSKKVVNNIVLTVGIALILFEIYKQIACSASVTADGKIVWGYDWNNFPFQFCSTPMYIMTLAGILRKGKVHNALMSYLGTFSFFGGICVLFYPTGVFSTLIGINIQTMFWHCSMFFVGFTVLVTKSIDLKFSNALRALLVFAIMVTIALLLNIIWHYYGTGAWFNLFYISPYFDCPLVILDTIYKLVPYPVFLLIYLVGFTLAGTIILLLAMLLDRIISSHKRFSGDDNIEKILKIIHTKL